MIEEVEKEQEDVSNDWNQNIEIETVFNGVEWIESAQRKENRLLNKEGVEKIVTLTDEAEHRLRKMTKPF